MIIPTIGHPISTTTIPPKNAALALSLCLWKKKLSVLLGPITHASPEMNNSCDKQLRFIIFGIIFGLCVDEKSSELKCTYCFLNSFVYAEFKV